jgi:essential nuclear protein 1
MHSWAAPSHRDIYDPSDTGPRSLFLRVLIDKKKDLPYKVLDELVFYFIRVSNVRKARGRADADKLPVLWHQSLLAFCQRFV